MQTNQSKYNSELDVYVLQGAPEIRVRRDRGMVSLGQGADDKRTPPVTPPDAEILHV